jgi:phospholipase/carboxylesterase
LIDGEVSLVEPNTITLIGRGQVHVLERASGLHGALVWFGEELLHGDPATGANPAWLVGSAAVRAPIAEGGRFAWFANRGIGRPVAESLEATIQWFRLWLDEIATAGRPVVLIGFSGGAAAAGGLLLADSQRSSGVAILSGTLPFEAGLDTGSGALAGTPVFVAQGDADTVIALGLQQRTWAYLHGDSGALITGHRDGGGHGLTLPAGDALRAWLAQRIA